jgi:hypothetical protein
MKATIIVEGVFRPGHETYFQEYSTLVRRYLEKHSVRLPEATRTHEVRSIVALCQARVGDGSAGTRRMNEAAAACVDPNVIDPAADVEARTEEHNVTGQHSIQRHRLRRAPLLVGTARHFQSRALMYIGHEPAAVEAVRIGAAELIGSSDKLSGRAHNRSTAIIGAAGCAGNVAAGGDHRDNEKQEHGGKEKQACSSQLRTRAPGR